MTKLDLDDNTMEIYIRDHMFDELYWRTRCEIINTISDGWKDRQPSIPNITFTSKIFKT